VTSCALQSRKWKLIGKSQWCCSTNCGHPLHTLTYNWTHGMQLANTPPLQSITPGLHPVSIHQTSPLVRGSRCPIIAYYSIINLERMKGWVGLVGWPVADSLPTWLVTHQLQVESWTWKVCRLKTNFLPLCHVTNHAQWPTRLEWCRNVVILRQWEISYVAAWMADGRLYLYVTGFVLISHNDGNWSESDASR